MSSRTRKPTVKSKAAAKEKAKQAARGSKAKTRDTKAKSLLELPLDSDDEEEVDGKEGVFVDWKDDDLNWALLTAITDSPEIKQGLFPSPGNDTRHGKGKRKTDHQFALATVIFSQHPRYHAAFALANTPAAKAVWTRKIKNRLDTMVRTCRQYTREMGETGAGITQEDEIDMSLNNEFTNKWGLIRNSFPWYFTMKELISERPNIVPVGLGNATTGFDTDILLPSVDSDDRGTSEFTAYSTEPNASATTGDSDEDPALEPAATTTAADPDEDLASTPALTTTRPVKSEHKPEKRTAARPSTSAPASIPPPSKKPKTTHEKFSEMAAKEEETTQKLIDLKVQKLQNSNAVEIATINAKTQIRLQREKLKADLHAKRLEQEYQLRLASMRASHTSERYWPSSSPYAGPSSPGPASWEVSSSHIPSSPLSMPFQLPNPIHNPFEADESGILFPSTST
ncbi:hypothetical protein FPV67DRAFT_1666168 [Lyophyllum atratum]|nr:hypothetical protein FPV67DRAFT_1666168 [Lyophyllum atratum]